jgi:NADH dehydrogenase/NADH:ubiquinone oxidoreductase subunit G
LCVLLGSFREEELDKVIKGISSGTKLIFIGTNGCEFTAKADLILPTTTFLEKEGFYMNLEGRIQKTQKATNGPALVRDSFKILRILKKRLKTLEEKPGYKIMDLTKKESFSLKSKDLSPSTVSRLPFSPFLTDFYISDSLSKYSTTMAKCSDAYRASFKNFF